MTDYVEQTFTRDFILTCSIGLNIGFAIGLVFLLQVQKIVLDIGGTMRL